MPSGEGIPVGSSINITSLKNLGQLRELVYVPLRDNERSFVEPWFVDAMLNEGYLDLNARLRLYRKTATGTTDAVTGAITVPTDMVELTDLWITSAADVANVQPELTSDGVFNSWANRGTDPPTYIARVFGSTIEVFPLLLSAAYELEYVARPTELSEDPDQPVVLDPEMTPRIVNYAIAKAKWQEGESEEGNQYMAMYEAGLPGSPRMTNKMRPAPMTMFPAPGPFD